MATLEKMTKAELVELAAANGLALDGDLSKSDMIADLTAGGIDPVDADAGDPDPDSLVFNIDPASLELCRAAFPSVTFENDIQVKHCLEVMTPTQRSQAQKAIADKAAADALAAAIAEAKTK
tara:strand:- start:1305 stop:1670 length:366 start_codon:yes stop_codon:yes gene_type:complete